MIKIDRLNKKFGDHIIFDNFNLTIEEKEMVAIVGESGSGKSTLLNIIGSLESYNSGDVVIDGIHLNTLTKRKQLLYLRDTISFVFQNYALMNDKKVYENINIGNIVDKEDVNNVLQLVGLENFAQRDTVTLSGGEQQRVALARALIKTSKVILADEPTGNLDEDNSSEVIKILLKFKEEGKTVVVVTHDESILKYFDRVIKLDNV